MNQPPFESAYLDALRALFEERIVFNKVIGLKLIEVGQDHALTRLDMRPELVGNFSTNRLHGGLISALLDATGGAAVLAALSARHLHEPPAKRIERFVKIGTIDLRVDFLRPGIGESFTARAEVLRLGSRVASTRMEFRGADGKLLSTGAAAYMVA
jgi:uncharacterized protein (TIGR00369 family)